MSSEFVVEQVRVLLVVVVCSWTIPTRCVSDSSAPSPNHSMRGPAWPTLAAFSGPILIIYCTLLLPANSQRSGDRVPDEWLVTFEHYHELDQHQALLLNAAGTPVRV
jgi:hypothetical protein